MLKGTYEKDKCYFNNYHFLTSIFLSVTFKLLITYIQTKKKKKTEKKKPLKTKATFSAIIP